MRWSQKKTNLFEWKFGRILCYKMSAASGLVELKCQKCGRTAVVNLSLRRAKGKLDYRTAKDIGTYIWRATVS